MRMIIVMVVLCCMIIAQGKTQSTIPAHMSRTCGSFDRLQDQLQDDLYLQSYKHIQKYVSEYTLTKELNGSVVSIPTVIHVVHNGDPIGTDENISDTYIQAQLDQLNDDYRRLNADADNTWSQATDMEIEFCLATIDPAGNSTTGILRHNVSQNGSGWTMNDFDNTVKVSTIWDSNNYLNIWSAKLAGGLLGYSSYPGGPANEDGVVCHFTTFGSLDTPNPNGGPYSFGRTCTHEIGHWLNLYHIWGNDNGDCTGSDFCADTPDQGGSNNSSCPTGIITDACSPSAPGVMYQNFMDYTHDACMNLFTEDQKTRAHATLNGVRSSLINAPCGPANPPVAYFEPGFGIFEYCENGTIQFTDISTGNPTSWSWSFTGAGVSPGFSNQQNPIVTVNASGYLNVTLLVSNNNGTSSENTSLSITVHGPTEPFCTLAPCLDFGGNARTELNYSDACALGGCPLIDPSFDVFENEGYILSGLKQGANYNFEFCSGYDPNVWNAIITIGEYDHATGLAVPNSILNWTNDCSIDFMPPSDGDYIAVITGVDNCSGILNQTGNGSPRFQCTVDVCADTCSSIFTDSGGLNMAYNNNINKSYLFCPNDPACENIQLDFTSFEVQDHPNCIYDMMSIYDGENQSASRIGNFCGNASPGLISSSHSSGCLFVIFRSDEQDTFPGWEAAVSCVPNGNCSPCPENYSGTNALTGNEDGSGGPNGNGIYETDGMLESGQNITGGNIIYNSSEGIILQAPFSIDAGLDFEIMNDGCTQTLTNQDDQK